MEPDHKEKLTEKISGQEKISAVFPASNALTDVDAKYFAMIRTEWTGSANISSKQVSEPSYCLLVLFDQSEAQARRTWPMRHWLCQSFKLNVTNNVFSQLWFVINWGWLAFTLNSVLASHWSLEIYPGFWLADRADDSVLITLGTQVLHVLCSLMFAKFWSLHHPTRVKAMEN